MADIEIEEWRTLKFLLDDAVDQMDSAIQSSGDGNTQRVLEEARIKLNLLRNKVNTRANAR